MNIYDFIKDPYTSVLKGYRPSYLDCVASCADSYPLILTAPFRIWLEFKDIWTMEVGDLVKLIFMVPVVMIYPIITPLLIWPAGYYLHRRLKTYPERRRRQMERQSRLITPQHADGEE